MKRIKWHLETRKVSDLKPYSKNPRIISDEKLKELEQSFNDIGFCQPININTDNTILSGHARVKQLLKENVKEVDVYVPDRTLTPKQEETVVIRMNKTVAGEWDFDVLRNEFNMDDLLDWGFEEEEFELKPFDYGKPDEGQKGSLGEKWGVPPFSIINLSKMQDRKIIWDSIIINSNKGRGEKLIDEKFGTSIFNPCLAEILYKWFCKKNGYILDPFCGGNVRGIVAGKLGFNYIGIDIREEQIVENKKSILNINMEAAPLWLEADSSYIDKLGIQNEIDLLLSCPPYVDLEVYSKIEGDISNKSYDDFIEAYSNIIKKSTSMLKNNSFAVFIVGEVRDKKGNYYNFIGDTVKAFIDAGLSYYNEIIIADQIGTLPVRAGRTFKASRKIGKRHQNALVFLKGDCKKASNNIGDIDNFMVIDNIDQGEL